ncbi:hypothetical protein [Neisseria yangbaofengii]|uniref:hypothetical protein n=1 Tax=Neisseria yangbaofengii TaxID=2709396 RepID=UPI0013EC71AF|nr:hypothetical protein [Neisseria yangbaofengii]
MRHLTLFIFCSMFPLSAFADNHLRFVAQDDFGNKVYEGLSVNGTYDFVLIDGGSQKRIASISIPVIRSSGEAGYAVVPASSFEEMGDNSQFAKTYEVDCKRKLIIGEDLSMKASDMNGLHQTASTIACSILSK